MATRGLMEWAGGSRVTLAVVFTDIIGSTALRATLRDERMNELLRAHFTRSDEAIGRFDGCRVKTTGDGLMAVFRSAGAALDFAREIHADPGSDELRLRVGVHVGEVNVEPADVAGIEVHVAARVVDWIPGSGIWLSDRAKGDVDSLGARHHEGLRWGRRDDVEFRGFEGRPFTLWSPAADTPVQRGDEPVPARPAAPVRRVVRTARSAPSAPRAGIDGRPAIAVLPFTNLSSFPDQAHFSDGIADDIINELASCRLFPVIARNSSFTFKEQSVDAAEIGRRLGARYVVEGSFTRVAQRVRISGRLIDAISGVQMAGERFERDFDELPAIQSQITEMIVGSIAPELLRIERRRIVQKPRKNATSYEHFLRGLEAHYRYTKIDNAVAQSHFRKAIEVDPQNAQAHALLAHAVIHAVQSGWREDENNNYGAADRLALRAVLLDPRAPFAHFSLGSTSMFLGRIDQALREMRETVRINPSHAAAHAMMAPLLCYVERPDEALESVAWALRLSPYDPRLGLWLAAKSQAHYFLKAYEEAATVGQQALLLIAENPLAHRFTAASLAQLGHARDAGPLVATIRRSRTPTNEAIGKSVAHLYRDPLMIEHMLDGLRKAGLE